MNTKPLTFVSNAPNAPQAIGPYSQAASAGGFIFTSGQIALDPATGQIVSGGVEAEAVQVMKNLRAVLAYYAKDFNAVAKATIFLADMNDFQKVNAIYEKELAGAKPARSTVQVAALPKGARIEIEMIAVQ